MTAKPRPDPSSSAASGLPLERRASLARETLRLIRDMTDSLVAQVQEARRRSQAAGDPEPMAAQIDALMEQATRLRRQGEQLTRAFAVLDRLVPPSPPAPDGPRAGGAAGARAGAPSRRAARRRVPPEDETRGAAFAFAHALRLEGASREHVQRRLVEEFGRRDAQQITDAAFRAPSG